MTVCPSMPGRTRRAPWPALGLLLVLGGCASWGPAAPPAAPAPAVASAWQAAAPPTAEAPSVTDLAAWWEAFGDPAVPALVQAAQQANPTVASAVARIAEARAARVAADAALGPTADASANALRQVPDVQVPTVSRASASVVAGWELDLWGANAAARDAALARLEAAGAGWHDARVSVAAEVASSVLRLRACEAQLRPAADDAASRAETARLTGLSAAAGFDAPAQAALARASAAQARSQLRAREAACLLERKALVALTGLGETVLAERLAQGTGRVPDPAPLAVPAVPAAALARRPDVRAAERALQAAAFDITVADAARLPRLSLSGSIGTATVRSGGFTAEGTTWSLGPLALSVPLFDGGVRRADVDAARARHAEAAVQYAETVRRAVREVEDQLVSLQSIGDRLGDARVARDGYDQSLRAAEARFRGGLGTLFELEEARRTALASRIELIDLERDRAAAWIGLYRALGGGWSTGSDGPALAQADAGAPR